MYNTLNLRAMENIPNKIYLQIGEDADITIDNSVNDFNDLYRGAITWNDKRINENYIEYERRQDVDLKNAALPIFDVSKSVCKHCGGSGELAGGLVDCHHCGNTGRCEPRTLSDPDGQECDCGQTCL